jgi:predicted dehydrogenase/nucleoside-diphosphate-sugar epimerase
MNVLVTGASGFIGQPLVRRLAADGHDVRALARRPEAIATQPRVHPCPGDMLDGASLDSAVQGMDAIVHLACATGVADEAQVRRVNVDGTRALLAAAGQHGVRRFVFVSTISATRERLGPYGRTKKECETLVAESGLEWVTVRPSLVYGSTPVGLFATLTRYLRALPVVPVIGDGRIELDPIHVRDVCEVIAQCVTRSDVVGKTYDLLGPDRLTLDEFLGRLARELRIRKPLIHIPQGLALATASVLGAVSKRPPVSVDNVIGMTSPARVDRRPAQRDFQIQWTPIAAGLRTFAHSSAAGAPWEPVEPVESVDAAAGAVAPVEAPAPEVAPRPSSVVASEPATLVSLEPQRPVRACVIGLGRMGVVHTAVLSMIPGCELVGIADRHAQLGRSVRGMGHRVPFFRSAAKMLQSARPDAVFVCTQQNSHFPLAQLALEAGAAVFVEKPLAHTLADAEALVALSARLNRPVACGYTLAYLPVFARAREAVAAIGTLRQARSSMYLSQVFGPRRGWMYDPSRSGGGVVANISSHLLFLLDWYFGTPVQVRASWKKLYGAVEDELHAMMTLPGGAEVGFESSWSVPGYPLSAVVIEMDGENGKLLVSNDALEVDLAEARAGWPAGHTRLGHAELPQPARFDVNGEGYYLEDAAFLAWVTGSPAPPTTAEAALRVQRTMDALYRSAAQGGAPVAVGA